MLCSVVGGAFEPNIETVESRYFGIDELPALAEEKNNEEQVRMCFEAYHAENCSTEQETEECDITFLRFLKYSKKNERFPFKACYTIIW